MQTEEILKVLSDNHRILILSGAVISFISLFLPFWDVLIYGVEAWFHDGNTADTIYLSIADSGIFWIFILLFLILYYGYVQKYGDLHPYFYLIIGVLLVISTFYAFTSNPVENAIDVRHSYGFYLELLGSLAVAVGGYYYYLVP